MKVAAFRGERAFLSNFTECDIEFEGKQYNSTEAAYQAAKTLDESERELIRLAGVTKGPGETKKLGQKVKLREDWENIKLSVMEDLLRKKFNQPKFAEKLLETGNEELVELNWWRDTFWGQCPAGVGFNHLGKLLMKIRTELQQNGYPVQDK